MTVLSRPPIDPTLLVTALLACSLPTLLAYHRQPSAIAINECLAVVLWGGVAALSFSSSDAPRKIWSQTLALIGALILLIGAAVGSWSLGSLPLSMALPAAGLLAAATLLVTSGASASIAQKGPSAFASLAFGLMIAGLASSAVGLLQVFAPGWADPDWISPTNVLGRATGNVRQPNQLATLLLWALVATVTLHELRWLPRAALWVATALLVWVLALTASRAGALGLVLLMGWALVDSRLTRTGRWMLSTTPLFYALAYGGMAWFNSKNQEALASIGSNIGVTLKIGNIDDRINVWKNAIDLILAQPWTGVGFGEFGFAWILTPFSNRGGQFFDNTHNLPLQLVVELGLPLAGLVIGLLLLALWKAVQRARRTRGDNSLVARAGLTLLLIVALHSMVEYPLWYAFFLLPAALIWGLVLGVAVEAPKASTPERRSDIAVKPPNVSKIDWGFFAGLAMSLAGVWSLVEYQKIMAIYSRPYPSTELTTLLERGQKSLLFAHYADFSVVMIPSQAAHMSEASIELGLRRAVHKSIDQPLLMFWADRLAARGRVDQARWLAQRRRELPGAATDASFAPCKDDASTAFQCQWPVAEHSWREFTVPIPSVELTKTGSAARPDSARTTGLENAQALPPIR